MTELDLESADRESYLRLIADADEDSLPVISLTVRGELVDPSVYEDYRGTYAVEIRTELLLHDLERFVSSLATFNETRSGEVALDSLGRGYVSFGFQAAKPGRISFFLRQRSLDTGEIVFNGRFPVDSEWFLDILSGFRRFTREIAPEPPGGVGT